MASENKKRKAKNSYIYNGAEKQKNIKCKRIWYYTKADRASIKKAINEEDKNDRI